MLKIWGRLSSMNVQKVLWCCSELDVKYERIDAGLQFGVNNTPEYKAMNPNGLVPTIDEDGFILWESNAIVRYLARKHGLGSLCPSDPKVCADADRWMDWQNTTVQANLRPVFISLTRSAAGERDDKAIEENRKKLSGSMNILNVHLANRKYVAGESFAMGDIPLGVSVHRWFNLEIKREPYPALEGYYHRLQARAAYKQFVDLPLK